MKIEAVLKMDSGAVVCIENSATITVKKSGGGKTFTASYPEGAQPMSAERFTELYKHKHFQKAKAQSSAETASK